MKQYRKLALMGIYIFIAIGVTAVALIFSGWYLRLKDDVYGREYNESRMKQEQPIIEDYFVRKPKRDEHLTVWSDSTQSHVHMDKSYFTNDYGGLSYETDYYKPISDSTWLRKQLGIAETEQLESWTFNRTYYTGKPEPAYEIRFRLKDGPDRVVIVNQHTGDSLYQTLN